MFRRLVILCAAVAISFGFLNVTKAQTKPRATTKTKQADDARRIGDEGYGPEVGRAGQIIYGQFKVVSVIDENNVLGEITLKKAGEAAYDARGVFYRKDAKSVVWLNMPTKGMVDDADYTTDAFFTVTETKQYNSAAGTKRTVFFLKMKTSGEIKQEQQQAAEELRKKRKAAVEKVQAEKEKRIKADTRTWTVGEEKYTAQFISRIGDKVILKKEDGTAVKVSVDDLGEADQQWIANRRKK